MFSKKMTLSGLIAVTAILYFLAPTAAYTQQAETEESIMEKGEETYGRRVGTTMFSRYGMSTHQVVSFPPESGSRLAGS